MSEAAIQNTATEKVDLTKAWEIIEYYRGKTGIVMPVLQKIQAAYAYVPKEAIYLAAEELDLSVQHLYGVLTFYAQFHLKPRGKYIVKVCRGTACHVNGASLISEAAEQALGLSSKEGRLTTPDKLFTVEEVACIGACALAPLVVVTHNNIDEAYGALTKKGIDELIAQIRENEKAKSN